MSPQFDHQRLEGVLSILIGDWAKSRGRVTTEWRFYLDLPEPGRHSLVPDVAYLSYDRLPREARRAAQMPHVAPDVAIEILSPDDWRSQVDRKTALYLGAGTSLALEVDPQLRTVTTRDIQGDRVYREGDILEHHALPSFRLNVADLFAALDE